MLAKNQPIWQSLVFSSCKEYSSARQRPCCNRSLKRARCMTSLEKHHHGPTSAIALWRMLAVAGSPPATAFSLPAVFHFRPLAGLTDHLLWMIEHRSQEICLFADPIIPSSHRRACGLGSTLLIRKNGTWVLFIKWCVRTTWCLRWVLSFFWNWNVRVSWFWLGQNSNRCAAPVPFITLLFVLFATLVAVMRGFFCLLTRQWNY